MAHPAIIPARHNRPHNGARIAGTVTAKVAPSRIRSTTPGPPTPGNQSPCPNTATVPAVPIRAIVDSEPYITERYHQR